MSIRKKIKSKQYVIVGAAILITIAVALLFIPIHPGFTRMIINYEESKLYEIAEADYSFISNNSSTKLAERDAWGNQYHFFKWNDDSIGIISPGQDGVLNQNFVKGYETIGNTDDIVLILQKDKEPFTYVDCDESIYSEKTFFRYLLSIIKDRLIIAANLVGT